MTPTPICDFVKAYAAQAPVRLHMPGHKGRAYLGAEPLDITEIDGADNLYAPAGIIAESERVASALFHCPTYYAAEGSSLAIRAMLYLARMRSGKAAVLAGRNAHRAFVSAAALLDLDVHWLFPRADETYQRCTVTAADVDAALGAGDFGCVYLTDPDYLGSRADLRAIAEVCRRRSVLLAVDCAHGAYLHFLPQPSYPTDLGADLCCASAHKTLPVLTGGAYLHVREDLRIPPLLVREALSLFGSTSPSYLILQSLDLCNRYLETFPQLLRDFLPHTDRLRRMLTDAGWTLCGAEPLKVTLCPQSRGYTGDQLTRALVLNNIYCEYHDRTYLGLMCTPQNTPEELRKTADVLAPLPARPPLPQDAPPVCRPQRVLSLREAILSARETLPADQCVGRVLACAAATCPPAVPIVQCGERIDEAAVRALLYYGVRTCAVTV